MATSCTRVCQELSFRFGLALHFPKDDIDWSIWDEKQREVTPACRVEPSSTADVSEILELLTTHWCRFAVKGGGHAQAVDASNSVGGVTIDLHRMDRVDISQDRTRANLGPGLVLGEAYSALEPYNLTFVGGRVADVGVPGFTLGGGISNLSPQYGLALDNVFEYEVVLPNASIVTASEGHNPDLYFALRGGGNNFGIVTNFLVRLVPQGALWSGESIYDSEYTATVIERVHELSTTLSEDTYMCFSSRYAYNQTANEYTIGVMQAYYEPIDFPAVFEQLNSIPHRSSTLRVDRMSRFAADAISPHGSRRLYATLTFEASAILHSRILQIFQEEVERVKSVQGFRPSVVTQALHVNAIKAMRQRGGNSLGVESAGPLNFVLLTFGWSNAEDDEAMSDFADAWVSRSTEAATELGILNPWIYINYAKENQDPFSGYGENKHRLRRIQRQIDPRGVFTSMGLCRGSFKLL
ncbi:unnamed protein product [Clonostachys solani]|uniref:FAD-binding PCMH-type domain-containing protein n=1 Tax=Clonostachys solani TaxID=160281 RepID=A0A9N9Z0M8_9HYPO|nr:unnamed protein product [Clonostachys solani]